MRKTHETTPSLRVKRFIEGVIKTASACLHEQFHFVNKHGFFVKNCSNLFRCFYFESSKRVSILLNPSLILTLKASNKHPRLKVPKAHHRDCWRFFKKEALRGTGSWTTKMAVMGPDIMLVFYVLRRNGHPSYFFAKILKILSTPVTRIQSKISLLKLKHKLYRTSFFHPLLLSGTSSMITLTIRMQSFQSLRNKLFTRSKSFVWTQIFT